MAEADREANKAVVRQFFEAYNDGNREAFMETLAEAFTYGETRGPEAMAEKEWKWMEAMDLTWDSQAMHANERFVTTRLVGRGTHRGEILGLDPTGKSFEVTAMTLSRVEDGLITEWWGQWDFAGLLNQLGAIDSPVYSD